MDLSDVIKVHIWQLPEKTNNIDKSTSYMIINDGYTKKILIEKLYEYFNQDYKTENTVKYFEDFIQKFDDEYRNQYPSLELSLDKYEVIVKELIKKFKTNRDNIRELETIFSSLSVDIQDIIEIFSNIKDDHSILHSIFDTLNNRNNIIKSNDFQNSKDIKELNDSILELEENADIISTNDTNIQKQVEVLKNSISNISDDKKNILLKNIESEYDKIIAIVDYYHHTHDQMMQ